jgi:phosphotransferase system HPr-like phosphotransfer protein
MKLRMTKVSVLAISLFAVTLSGVPALALGAVANSHASAATQTTTGQPTNPGSQGETKLASAKLKACQKRETAINNIMSRISDRGQKQLDLFTSIATRTETFYTNKGKTLSNYSTLVADVTAKKDAAQTAVEAVKGDSVTFKCDGTDPKGAVSSFKEALKSEISALKDYKTSVKNLIVGVKSVQGTTTSTGNKTTGGN